MVQLEEFHPSQAVDVLQWWDIKHCHINKCSYLDYHLQWSRRFYYTARNTTNVLFVNSLQPLKEVHCVTSTFPLIKFFNSLGAEDTTCCIFKYLLVHIFPKTMRNVSTDFLSIWHELRPRHLKAHPRRIHSLIDRIIPCE